MCSKPSQKNNVLCRWRRLQTIFIWSFFLKEGPPHQTLHKAEWWWCINLYVFSKRLGMRSFFAFCLPSFSFVTNKSSYILEDQMIMIMNVTVSEISISSREIFRNTCLFPRIPKYFMNLWFLEKAFIYKDKSRLSWKKILSVA